ncbi:MAG: GNAT family N-acetyltransferase [Candidatus Levybacteria bacterium]|nr:GNAT family N-acetyltransferase [Candidatus Levybacteria bacterium]
MDDPTVEKEMLNQVIVESVTKIPLGGKEEFLTEVIDVEKSAWRPELQASKKKFVSRLEIFPQGFIVAKVEGRIKGVTTSQITTYDPLEKKTWNEITDNGMIKRTHNPAGNALYVVSVAVAADAQGMGVGSKLVEEQKKIARQLGLKLVFLGARIPGYNKYCEQNGEISVEEYLALKNQNGESVDPEIRFYERQGLRASKIIPEFEPDIDSRNYGVVVAWENTD